MNGATNTPPPATTGDKLSGQLIIKAQLGDDIRKMTIHNEDLTFNELVLMMERIFAGKISNSDELTIKYLDDDGDKITLLDDSDLAVALHFHKILRLFVLVNGQEQLNNSDNSSKEGSLIDAKTFRNELQQIRNSVQTILDRLQIPTNQETSKSQEKEGSTTATTNTVPTPTIASNTAREFDPYKHLQQTQRSTTPDSIRSKSSLTKRTFSNEQKAFQTTSTAPPHPPAADTPQQFQPTEPADAMKTSSGTAFQPTQMPTSHFVPTAFNDQQGKTSPYTAPPTTFTGMPPLPNSGASGFPTSFSHMPLPNANANASSGFNTAAPPLPPTTGQTSTFIGQQQTPVAPPPQQAGFYGQQQALSQQQRTGYPAFNNATTATSTNNAYGQPPQSQTSTPPTSSSPATINPSYVQPTAMPAPPPLATQQPYGGYPTPNNYYNPTQQYPRT